MTSLATSVLTSRCEGRHPSIIMSYRKGRLIDLLSNNQAHSAAPWTSSQKSVQRLKIHLNLIVRAWASHFKEPLSSSESRKSTEIKRTLIRPESARNKKWLRPSPLLRERWGRWSKNSPCARPWSMHSPSMRTTQVRKKTKNMTLKVIHKRVTRLP